MAIVRKLTAEDRDAVATRIGMHPRKLRSFKDSEQGLTLDESLALASDLGDGAVNALLATIGYGGAHRLGEAVPLPRMAAQLTRAAAAIHDAIDVADGVGVQRRDKARVRGWLLTVGARCFAGAAQLAIEIGS